MSAEGWARRRRIVCRDLERGPVLDAICDVVDALAAGELPRPVTLSYLADVVNSECGTPIEEAQAAVVLSWARVETPLSRPSDPSWGSTPLHPDARAFVGGLRSTC